jgi:hypothetical protein
MPIDLMVLIEAARKAYGDFQDQSLMGRSPMDKMSRRMMNFGCGILIALVLMGAFVFGMYFA